MTPADFVKKNAFSHSWQLYTVTQDEKELRKAAHMFGGGGRREDQHMWDGQGLKDPCFLPKGGLDIFLNFLTLKTF